MAAVEQADWVTRYEAIRALVTGETPASSPARGLAIFLRHGLAGWMRAWPNLPPPLPKYRERIGGDMRRKNDVVSLLLEMAIQAATDQRWSCNVHGS
jgi:pimeloyl-ACP methyl ester carboxylesterase